jgi:hypothetical protein
MNITQTAPDRKKPHRLLFASVALTVVVYGTHIYLRETGHPPGGQVRMAATWALIASVAFYIYAQVQVFRHLDEFERQVHFLALAIAFPSSFLAMFAVGFLRAEGYFAGADPRDLFGIMGMAYAIGLAIAWAKYR